MLNKQYTRSVFTSLVLSTAVALPSWSQSDTPLVLLPSPGKAVCRAKPATLAGAPVKAEICVTQGNFSHDLYVLKIDGSSVLKGIDDETTKGISSSYKSQKVSLTCAPQELAPNASLEEVHKILPGYSSEKAKGLVALMKDSKTPTEVGRLCTASSDGTAFLSAQVIFD